MNLKRACVSALAALSIVTTLPSAAGAGPKPPDDRGSNPTTVAVIGDVPYGTEQEVAWHELIAAINDDPKVDLAAHVGDVKSGSTTCTDERLAAVAADFETFRDPVVYTPGDNEWTDCHRANNGGYDPLERLDAVRSVFFSEPGTTPGRRRMGVDAQSGYPENVRWVDSQVVFAAVHVVGSDNGMAPWTGNTAPTPAQEDEVEGRIDAARAWIDGAFDQAEQTGAEGVVLLMQADTWRPSPTPAQQDVVDRIAERTATFAGEVMVLQGDSHTYVADNPLGFDNFQRVVVHGEDLPFEYLRLTIDPRADELFTWERVHVTDQATQPPGKALDALVVGHRGASGYRPEHTLAAYQLAIEQCADYIEPDLVMTEDGVLVARHENEIGGTTDVESHPEFADRHTTKTIDGQPISGWFTEDFTLAELQTLRAEERIPGTRPANTAYDGLYQVPTFEEVIELAQSSRTCDGKNVGIYPETKHASYFDSIGLSMEEPLVALLDEHGYRGHGAPVIIQSFEVSNLQDLDGMTNVKIAQLVNCSGAPYDFVASGDGRTYADLVTSAGLDFVASYADGIGACKNVLIPRNADGTLGEPTTVIDDAHTRRLIVHGWTFRAENQFLPAEYRSSTDPNALGDMAAEVRRFVAAGMDGFFTDQPDRGAAAVR
jgi:glycerophosphoryl diester phosphodiesterase